MPTTIQTLNADIARLTSERATASLALAQAQTSLKLAQRALTHDNANGASAETIANTMNAIDSYTALVQEREQVLVNIQRQFDDAVRRKEAYLKFERDALAAGMTPEQAAEVAASKVATSQTIALLIRWTGYILVAFVVGGILWYIWKRRQKK